MVVTEAGRTTFRALYQQLVDQVLADAYIEALLTLGDMYKTVRAVGMEAAHTAPARSGRMSQQGFADMSDVEFG